MLVEQAGTIVADSHELLKDANVSALRANAPIMLSSLGQVQLSMTIKQVENILGKPAQKKNSEHGETWRYDRSHGKTLYVIFNQEGHVTHVSTDSSEFKVPNSLGVGSPQQDFESLYGARALRKSDPLKMNCRLIKYPLSQLALIVDDSNDFVVGIMVFYLQDNQQTGHSE